MASPEWNALQHLWPIVTGGRIGDGHLVANNDVRFVDAPVGRFVLRRTHYHADPARLRYEHAVVTQLQAAKLPFRVPAPLPTANGETFAPLQMDGREVLVSLWPFIGGHHSENSTEEQIRQAGRALAKLDEALCDVHIKETSALTPPALHENLRRCHPLVPDPLAAAEHLPVDEKSRRAVASLLRDALTLAPQLYGTLPRQITHNDYDPSNLLMDGNRVMGILDFEFSAPDVRAMDLAAALLGWAGQKFGSGQEWEMLAAFSQGYQHRLPLQSAEIEALPHLFRVRAASSLVHRMGRYRQGLNTASFLKNHVAGILHLEAWLDTNQAKLIRIMQG